MLGGGVGTWKGIFSLLFFCFCFALKGDIMTKSLLDKNGPVYYVYTHYEIIDGEKVIRYVGKGSGGRAWDARPTTRGNNGGHNDHCGWICDKILDRVEFVDIVASRVLSSEALKIEKELKAKYKPLFNTV